MTYFHKIDDSRGHHSKFFIANEFPNFEVSEIYSTTSKKNVIRGFHSSLGQNKVIQVLSGLLEVIVLDENLNIVHKKIMDNQTPPLRIDKGFWLGYKSLEENTVTLYIASGEYKKEEDLAMNPNVYWDISGDVIISDRDKNAPSPFNKEY